MTFRELINSVDSEQYSDSALYQKLRETKPEYGSNRHIQERLADSITAVYSFYTDIIEEPLIAGQFLVYSGPTVLLLMDGKEIHRASQFIDLEELKYNINRYIELLAQ